MSFRNSKKLGMQSGTRPQSNPPRSNVVRKNDRVGPTKETAKKLAALTGPSGTACQLRDMVHIGDTDPANPAGMSHEQYEAARRIWSAHVALTAQQRAATLDLQKVGHGSGGDMSDKQAEAVTLLLAWQRELPHAFYITADTVLAWIEGQPSNRMVNDSQRRILKRCLDLWVAMEKGRPLEQEQVAPTDDRPSRIRTWVK